MFRSREPDTRQEVLVATRQGSPSRSGGPRGGKTWWVEDRTWEAYDPLFEGGLLGLQGCKYSPTLKTHGKDHGFIREKISPLA